MGGAVWQVGGQTRPLPVTFTFDHDAVGMACVVWFPLMRCTLVHPERGEWWFCVRGTRKPNGGDTGILTKNTVVQLN